MKKERNNEDEKITEKRKKNVQNCFNTFKCSFFVLWFEGKVWCKNTLIKKEKRKKKCDEGKKVCNDVFNNKNYLLNEFCFF